MGWVAGLALVWGGIGAARADGPLAEAGPRGRIELVETQFTVGRKVTIEVVYTAGTVLAPGAEIRLHDPLFHAMRWSKWGDLSPWAEDCTEATESPPASWGRVTAHAERDGTELADVGLWVERSNCDRSPGSCDAEIYLRAHTTVRLESGLLQPGDEIVVVMGDTTADAAVETSNCGFQISDRSFPAVRWLMEECLGDKHTCTPLDPPVISIVPEAEGSSLQVVVPSQARAGEGVRVKAALLDSYGNAVTADPRELVLMDSDGQELDRHRLTAADGGWHDFEVVLTEPGVHRFTVAAGDLQAGSNPVEISDEAPEFGVYWGDIHVHNGYTWTDEDGFYHDYNHDYGRDVVGLDIVSESQKASGIELNVEQQWAELQESCTGYTLEDEYLVLLGFEWIGDVAAGEFGTSTDGHQNVYYDACDGPLGTVDTDVIDGLAGPRGLWAWVDRVRQDTGIQAVTLPHAMQWTGFNYDVAYPGTQTLAEIYSSWGDNTEWTADLSEDELAGGTQDLLRHGLRLGWVAASDNHNGWMGNPYAGKHVPGGLGAYLARSLRRGDVFDAMQQRRTYATTGHRPILRFQAEDGGQTVQQGAEYLAEKPRFTWELYGTEEQAKLTVWAIEVNPDAVQVRLQEEDPEGPDAAGGLALDWDGSTPMAVWLEARQTDAERVWSSPIWITADCARLDEGAVDPLGRCAPQAGRYGGGFACTGARGGAVGALIAALLLLVRRARG